MKFKTILAVLVLFSCQWIGSSLAAEPVYNRPSGQSSSARAPINLNSLSGGSRASFSSGSRRSQSARAVYNGKQQNAGKFRLSMTPEEARRTRKVNAERSAARRKARDEAAAERLALAEQAITDQASESPVTRNRSSEESRVEEEEEVQPQRKKRRIYRAAEETYKTPRRVFNFN